MATRGKAPFKKKKKCSVLTFFFSNEAPESHIGRPRAGPSTQGRRSRASAQANAGSPKFLRDEGITGKNRSPSVPARRERSRPGEAASQGGGAPSSGGGQAGAPGGFAGAGGLRPPGRREPPAPGSPQGLARASGKPPSPQTRGGAAQVEPRRRTGARREVGTSLAPGGRLTAPEREAAEGARRAAARLRGSP